MTAHRITHLAARGYLSAILLIAGGAKLLSLSAAGTDFARLFDADDIQSMGWRILVLCLAVMEIALAGLVLLWRKQAWALATVFLLLVGGAGLYTYRSKFGAIKRLPCGCALPRFHEDTNLAAVLLLRNGTLLLVAAMAIPGREETN